MTDSSKPAIVPDLPNVVPSRGGRFSRWFGRSLLRLMGWRVTGSLPAQPRMILIGAPHSSNWDFVIAMAVMFAIGIRISFFIKHTVFVPGLRGFLHWLGGVPVDRKAPGGLIEETIRVLQRQPSMVLALTPEGTRKRVERWKTGFYRIAQDTGLPVVPVGIDNARRIIEIGAPFELCGVQEFDMTQMHAWFERFPRRDEC
jgi:1-acyl-sn-glycerol-3-phosphate acyltransferase